MVVSMSDKEFSRLNVLLDVRTLRNPDRRRIRAPSGPGQPHPVPFQLCGLGVFSALR